jgi:hypothetical protein
MRPILSCFLCLGFAFMGAAQVSAAMIAVERSVGTAQISRVAALPNADLVVIDAGFEAGLREGMVCTVFRAGESIGQLLLVDLRPRSATALILDLTSGRSLQSGDSVAVKTVSSRK